MTTEPKNELLPLPYVAPRFGIGDIVVPSDECPYRHDYRGIYLIIAEVSFDPSRDTITYSTLPWPNESKEGMTTDWPESDLTLHKANAWNTRPQEIDVEAIRREFKKAFRGDSTGTMDRGVSKRIDRAIGHLASSGSLK